MDRHDLHVHNDDTATYWGDGDNNYSIIIDLTLTTPGVTGKIASWAVLEDDEHATGSDHEIIEWMVDLGAVTGERVAEVKGWAITELLADDNKTDEAKREWQSQMAGRPMLSNTAEVDQLEEEAQHIQDSMVRVLDMHARKIRLCARSKKWWSEAIQERRKDLGRVSRLKRWGRADQAAIRQARNAYKKEQRAAQKQSWENFLDNAKGENVWSVAQYTKPSRVTTVPTIQDSRGNVADTHDKKAAMLAKLAFPPPVEYQEGAGEPGEPGRAYKQIDWEQVQQAIFAQSQRKAPGPDKMGMPIVRLMWLWDPLRVTALVRTAIRLQTHPRAWKVARGVTIPKPGKDDYSKAKSYGHLASQLPKQGCREGSRNNDK